MEPGTVAPYGKACSQCAKAKCRCVMGSSDVCERCLRLNKPCQQSRPIRKRRAVISKSSQIEEKLDGLVSLLKSVSQPGSNVASQLEAASARLNIPSSTPSSGSVSHISPIESAPSQSSSHTSASYQTSSLGHDVLMSNIPGHLEPLADEAEELLTIFRTELLIHFAFVYLSPTTTAQQLRLEKPFFYLAIMAVSSKSAARRTGIGQGLRRSIAHELLLGKGGNFDILLSILTYVSWGHDKTLVLPCLSHYIHLAMSLVFELRINKALPSEVSILPQIAENCRKPQLGNNQTLEKRRALLGCFYLSSITSIYFGKMDSLRWTSYMDSCLEILKETQECPTDGIFANQVQLQLIIEKSAQAAQWRTLEPGHSNSTRAPFSFHIKALESEVQDLKRKLSPELLQNYILLCQMYNTEASINEIAFPKPSTHSNDPVYHRLDNLFSCLNATKNWFDLFFTMPLSTYRGIPFPFFTQLARSIGTLYKLSALDYPGWDRGFVRNTVDIFQVIDQIVDNLERWDSMDPGTSEDDIAKKTSRLLKSVKSWCNANLPSDTSQLSYPSTNEVSSGTLPELIPMDLMDDMWLSQLIGAFD